MKKFWEELEAIGAMLIAACSVLVMIPGIMVAVVGHEAGMLVSILLLLAVNPFFFMFLGMYGAKKGLQAGIKGIIFSGAAFAFGALAALQMSGEFIEKYTAVYMVIGFAAMGITLLIRRKKEQ
ncbi:MAG: hypothetical protein IJE22_00310 [Oscillibacter sp.]|nr:hypothetical protein [Oscillibacter sp.]